MQSLFSSFREISISEWKEQLIKDLKGKTFEDLSMIDENGITVFPFYNAENQITEPKESFTNPEWEILSFISISDEKTANERALLNLENGATALNFVFEQEKDINFKELLKGIQLQFIYSTFYIKSNIGQFYKDFTEYLENENLIFKDLNCHLAYDPIRELIINNTEFKENSYISFFKNSEINHLSVDGSIYQNAGATSSFQLACINAHLNEYLHLLSPHHLNNQIKTIQIKLAAGTLFFEEIAKLRALRIMVNNLLEAYSMNAEIHIAAETSQIYLSSVDIYNNVLRNCISGMAAVLGGCDSLQIHDFENENKKNPEFANRMGRNQQLIFKEESYLNKVADISEGSYYIETLTGELAEEAWTAFQGIEKENGLLASLKNGSLEDKIQQQSDLLIQEYKDGKRVLIGVNKHVNLMEHDFEAVKYQQPIRLKFINLNRELQDSAT